MSKMGATPLYLVSILSKCLLMCECDVACERYRKTGAVPAGELLTLLFVWNASQTFEELKTK